MSKVAVRYGAAANAQDQGSNRAVGIKVKEISVGTSSSDLIQFDNSFGTLLRANAKRFGRVVVFSFVFEHTGTVAANIPYFTIDSSIAPEDQIDFIGANYSSNDNKTGIIRLAVATSNSVTTLFSYNQITAGNTRGEAVWFTKGD